MSRSPLLTALDLDLDLDVVNKDSPLEEVLPEDTLRRLLPVCIIIEEPTEVLLLVAELRRRPPRPEAAAFPPGIMLPLLLQRVISIKLSVYSSSPDSKVAPPPVPVSVLLFSTCMESVVVVMVPLSLFALLFSDIFLMASAIDIGAAAAASFLSGSSTYTMY